MTTTKMPFEASYPGGEPVTRQEARAEGFAAMSSHLTGCLGKASVVEPREAVGAWLEGALARLDETRARIVEWIGRAEASVERAAEAETESYRSAAEEEVSRG